MAGEAASLTTEESKALDAIREALLTTVPRMVRDAGLGPAEMITMLGEVVARLMAECLKPGFEGAEGQRRAIATFTRHLELNVPLELLELEQRRAGVAPGSAVH